jgi:ABC-type polysaccharide/polyol phosphate transport system ATPase subunit
VSLVRAEDLGIQYLFDRQQRTMSPMMARFRRVGGENWALRDVSFEVRSGEGMALLGASGSGKSTLLRAIAGILAPDEGRMLTEGLLGPLLSIQAGVMAALSGPENTLLLGVLAGMTPSQARSEVPQVERLSQLDEQFEHLVGSYSQGMRARLGLAVIECTEPKILLLDEVHEALDHEFRDHVESYAHELIAAGGIVIATGHDHPMLERLCTRALHLENGRLMADGDFVPVQRGYLGDRRV